MMVKLNQKLQQIHKQSQYLNLLQNRSLDVIQEEEDLIRTNACKIWIETS